MAEPGDPREPQPPRPDVDHDDAIGFASPSSLQGRPIRPSEPDPEPEADLFEASTPEPQPEPVVAPEPAPIAPEPQPRPEPIPAAPPPTPAWAIETPPDIPPPGRPHVRSDARARVEPRPEVEGGTGLFSVYALILFAVPTLGVSALIALFAVTGRPGPKGAAAASHFIYQQRTLWAGAVVALLGAILIAVGLGVFVLFVLAVWLILRGAAGVLKLKAGRPIPNPRAWLI